MTKLWWFIKCLLGFGTIYDGSLCWFSERHWDKHDYPKHKGGESDPMHFFTYQCPKCGKRFSI